MRYAYPANLEPDDDGDAGFTVTFDGMPGVTHGGSRDEALRQAVDCLISIVSIHVEDGVAMPVPQAADGRPMVALPLLVSAKAALHDAMVTQGVTVAALARRIGIHEKAIRRLRDPLHGSKIEAVEAALRHLGVTAILEYQAVA